MVVLGGRAAFMHLVHHGWDASFSLGAALLCALFGLLMTVHSIRGIVKHLHRKAIQNAENKRHRM